MTALTEAEIREAIMSELGNQTFGADDFGGLVDAFRAILDSDQARSREPSGWDRDYHPDADHPGTLWADMTVDEVGALTEPMYDALNKISRDATVLLVEAVVAAAVDFAEKHPDVPRGRWQPEPVPA